MSGDVAEHVVALLQLAQRRGDVVGHVLVEPVGQRRVEHLRADVRALAELLGGPHLRDQLARDRLAVGVRREGPQHVGVPGPLLEHLRGRLDEVPLGGHAGEPGPLVVAASTWCTRWPNSWNSVTTWSCSIRFREKLQTSTPSATCRSRMPAARSNCAAWPYFPVARVQVEVDPAEPRSPAHHVVRRDVLVPGRRVRDLDVLHVEEPAGHGEQPGPDPGEVEVRAGPAGRRRRRLAAQHLRVVHPVHRGDLLDLGVVLLQPPQQHARIAAAGGVGGVGDPLDELRDRRPLADHLDLGVVGRPAVVAEQLGVLAAQPEQLVQQRVVLRVGPVEERPAARRAPPGRGRTS